MENNVILGWDIGNINKNDFLRLLNNIKEYYENPLNAEDDEDVKQLIQKRIKKTKINYIKLNIVEFIELIKGMNDIYTIKEYVFTYIDRVYFSGCKLLAIDYIGINFGQNIKFNDIKMEMVAMGLNPITIMIKNMIGEEPKIFAINITGY